ncbi:hypothetical protein H257_11891 [Aphanomyces astaci]|uniref:Uncharacterized protein n=1 Tax=Aphanomyces astaci TaxID=112090 RepID=W4G285_APHAT|nr:hypothetical protein H257_11891 [Aphanomyces astaci]ETV73396.1 hypothetical protein H257_11891 [Aphanomyces astaci]|eukprot:XP_009837271.1 hypothetical protein H257_11891 [Aphanomyces astaci]
MNIACKAPASKKQGPVAESSVKLQGHANVCRCHHRRSATGAMSYAFIATMDKFSLDVTYQDLLKTLRVFMYSKYTHVLCLSAWRALTMKVKFALRRM